MTHMEELQEALKGKTENNLACVLHGSVSLSQPSLEQSECKGRQCAEHTTSNALQNDYMRLHRHSICSLMEFKDVDEIRSQTFEKHRSNPVLDLSYGYFCNADDTQKAHNDNHGFFALSPIEENSEPSTRSGSYKDDNRILNYTSCSCDLPPHETHNYPAITHKPQTFPRSKDDDYISHCKLRKVENREQMSQFPLEPREIDPFAYYQLHTADSQEDLQEFLLLESECINDYKGAGLAAAFSASRESNN